MSIRHLEACYRARVSGRGYRARVPATTGDASVCGRYASTTTDKELRSLFDVVELMGAELPPSYNVAPTQQVRVVLERAPREEPKANAERQIRTVKWGPLPG